MDGLDFCQNLKNLVLDYLFEPSWLNEAFFQNSAFITFSYFMTI